MKILTLDLETSPHLSHVWGLWQQNVGLSQLLESGEVICFAAKWLDKKKIIFHSIHHDGKVEMLNAAFSLLDEAEVVVTYNGKRFDMPHLNREFIEAGMQPPSPYAQVDLLQVAKKQFRFPSNKLDYVSQTLTLGGKVQHSGHQLWIDCLAGKDSAWRLMRQYNRHDVALTERLYLKLLPWINNHPHYGLYTGDPDCCPNCGGVDLERRGYALTGMGRFQRYRCRGCGTWSRSSRREFGVGNTQIK